MLFGMPPFKGENHIHLLRVIEATEDSTLTFPNSLVIRSSNSHPHGIKRLTGHRVLSTTLQISVSNIAKDLIHKLLIKDPTERISFPQFFEHQFFENCKFQKIAVCTESLRHSRSSSSASNLTESGKDSMLTSLLSLSIENDLILEILLNDIDQQNPVNNLSILNFYLKL
jgi:serine/threonine protein kinase